MSAPIQRLEGSNLHVETPAESQMRKRSTGQVELQDEHGRRRTVALEELNDADRALAEKFGYKPVRILYTIGRMRLFIDKMYTGLQARVRLPLYFLLCSQY